LIAVDARVLYCRELIFVNALGVVQQPADERRLAVVDRAGRGKTEEFAIFVLAKKLFDRSRAH
jgi:hypothetical protein